MLTCLYCGRRFPQAEVEGPVCPACGERELQLEFPPGERLAPNTIGRGQAVTEPVTPADEI